MRRPATVVRRPPPPPARPRNRASSSSAPIDKDAATNYVSAGAEWRFDDDESIAFFNVAARREVKGNRYRAQGRAQMARGGLRCVSGICRVFPAFSGARAELTLRF